MKAYQALYPVTTLCRVLGVSSSGYYARRKRPPSARSQADARLQAHMEAIHAWSGGTYGTPRILAQLRQEGVHGGGKRVARLLRQAGLQGVSRRPQATTTRQAKDRRPAPDLVNRDVSAVGPDQRWVADITYVPTWAGFIYLTVVLDAFRRRLIGWATRAHLGPELGCWMPSIWRWLSVAPRTSFIMPTQAANTPPSPLASAVQPLGYGRRWARPATALTRPCANVSLPP